MKKGFRRIPVQCAAAAAIALSVMATQPAQAQFFGMDPGEVLFGECRECHSFEAGAPHGKKGPNLWGIFGRPAASAPGFEYSPELKGSGIVWTETALERWLRNPRAWIPATKMDFQVPNEEQREYILEYMRNADIAGYIRALQGLKE